MPAAYAGDPAFKPLQATGHFEGFYSNRYPLRKILEYFLL
jgi:hypothetical protein